MPFVVLIIFALAYVQTRWPEPVGWLTPFGGALMTWGGVVLGVAAAQWIVWRFQRCLRQAPERAGVFLRRYLRCRQWHLYGMLAGYLSALYLAGWGWTVTNCLTATRWTKPGAELLILLPFLTGLFLSWSRFYDAETALRWLLPEEEAEPFVSRWAYVGLHARQSLILAAPPFVLLLIQQCLFVVLPDVQRNVYVMPVLSGVLLVGLFLGYPWLLRVLLDLKPLPEGPLRQRLQEAARRLAFRCSNILVWNTNGAVATAMLTGALPLLRYVILTDRLIQHMDEEEIEAVFAHEVGHVKHRHIQFYFVFLAASLVTLTGAWRTLLDGLRALEVQAVLAAQFAWLDGEPNGLEWLSLFPLFAGLALYVFVVFGFLSRRCERQADLYACRSVSFRAFLSALEKVVWLNGISRDRPGWLASWRHGSIGQRVDFLARMQKHPPAVERFHQETGWLKRGIIGALVLLLVALGPDRILAFLQVM
jgi:Zn-dependent protease with chaperone function